MSFEVVEVVLFFCRGKKGRLVYVFECGFSGGNLGWFFLLLYFFFELEGEVIYWKEEEKVRVKFERIEYV